MTWFRVGGAGIPASLKNAMNAVFNKKFGTSGQNYPPKQWPDDVNLLGPLPEKTVAGLIAQTDDAADTVPVKSMICSIVPKQSGSGTPSPTNVRALSGYTGLTATHVGKNLLNINRTLGTPNPATGGNDTSPRVMDTSHYYVGLRHDNYYYPTNVASYSVENGEVYIKGANNAYGIGFPVEVKSSTIYTISGTTDQNPYLGVAYYDSEWNFIAAASWITSSGNVATFQTASNCRYAVIILRSTSTSTGTTWTNVQLEVGSTATTYEAPVTPESISDSWSSIGAIYGGERDLTLGTLKKTMNVQVYRGDDLDSVSITYGSTAEGYTHLYFAINGVTIADNPTADNTFSNMAPWSNGASGGAIPSAEGFRILNGGSPARPVVYWYVNKTWTDVAAFKAWLNDNPFVLCYPVAQTTYSDLQTYDFETLYAVNNFYSDIEGGQTQVTYRQDIALALQAVSSSRGLMMASRPVTQLIGEESDPDQVNELVENDETEQEGEDNAR